LTQANSVSFSASPPSSPDSDRDAPHLTVDSPGCVRQAVHVRNLDPALLRSLAAAQDAQRLLGRALRVTVARADAPVEPDMPAIAGTYEMRDDAISFIPYFPFSPGVPYYALFDPRELAAAPSAQVQTLAFEQPVQAGVAATVLGVYPSGDTVPDNLLRLYVVFSTPMQRGSAGVEIAFLDADGREVPDVLYRAPVELWDRSMRCLTVMLDPGRLKRGVGPHRALGPPLVSGRDYLLRVGQGMRDAAGRALGAVHQKRFTVNEAVRAPVALRDWIIELPSVATCVPLSLTFPSPLDWAMLQHSIRVLAGSTLIAGHVESDLHETRWRFTPAAAWVSGDYRIEVAIDLEDPCGNDLRAAFDRAFEPLAARQGDSVDRTFAFSLK
jgi:hypothetical protein